MKKLSFLLLPLILAMSVHGQDPAKAVIEKQINDSVNANGVRQITGPRLNTVLHSINLLGMDTTQVLNTINAQLGRSVPTLVSGVVPFSQLPSFLDTLYIGTDTLYYSIHHVPFFQVLPSTGGGGGGSDSGFAVLHGALVNTPLAKFVDGSGHRYVQWDSLATNPGAIVTQASRQKLSDSLQAISNALFATKKNAADSAANSSGGYTTQASRQKLSDSLQALIALKKNISDSIANDPGGYTTQASRQKAVDSILAVMNTALALKANIASPTFTGVPAAPTASPGTITTQLATTAFVANAVASSGADSGFSVAYVSVSGQPLAKIIPGGTSKRIIELDTISADPTAAVMQYQLRQVVDSAIGLSTWYPDTTDPHASRLGRADGSGNLVLRGLVDTSTDGSVTIDTTLSNTHTIVHNFHAAGGAGGSLSQSLALGNTAAKRIIDTASVYADSALFRSGLVRGPVQFGTQTYGAPVKTSYGNGASVIEGNGASSSTVTSNMALLTGIHDQTWVNQGQPGTATCAATGSDSSLRNRIHYDCPTFNAATMGFYVISVGDGDVTTDSNFFKSQLVAIIDTIQAHGWPNNRIIVYGPIWSPLSAQAEKMVYDTAARVTCDSMGIGYASVLQTFKHNYPGDIASDSLHPNDIGHRYIYYAVNYYMWADDMVANVLMNQNLTVKGNDTVGGSIVLSGGIQQPTRNVLIPIVAPAETTTGDIAGFNFTPTLNNPTNADSFFVGMINAGSNRQDFDLNHNGNQFFSYHTTGGSTGVMTLLNAVLIGQGVNATTYPHQWEMVNGGNALNTTKIGQGVSSGYEAQFYGTDAVSPSLSIGTLSRSDTTTFTRLFTVWDAAHAVVGQPDVVTAPTYHFQVYLKAGFKDTVALEKVASYTTNLGSSFHRYSHVDKNYVDSSIAASTGGSGGIYLPASSGSTNVATITPDSAVWVRGGNIITVTGAVTIAATSGTSAMSVYLSVPVNSLLSNGHALFGMTTNSSSMQSDGIVKSDGTANKAWFSFANPGATSSVTYYYHYSYQVQ